MFLNIFIEIYKNNIKIKNDINIEIKVVGKLILEICNWINGLYDVTILFERTTHNIDVIIDIAIEIAPFSKSVLMKKII